MISITNVYKCEKCGRLVELVGLPKGEPGELFCDETPMVLQKPKDGAGGEKHIPIVTKTAKGYLVTVGAVEHPMEQSHYIQWLQFETGGVLYRKQLTAEGKPEYEFIVDSKDEKYIASAYCNVHGLWDSLSVSTDVPMIDDRCFARDDPSRFWRD